MTSMLLLGSTDLTRSIADGLVADRRVALAGVVSPPAEFRISYSAEPLRNSRFVDMAAWCREHDVAFTPYATPDDIARAQQTTGACFGLLVGWYHLVPSRIRTLFDRGCAGVHASLLPRYRGGAPLNWALLNGDEEAGVSLFELGEGVDDGLLYDQRRFPITREDYISDLLRKAEATTLDMLRETLPRILNGGAERRPQSGKPSYALARQPSDGTIDWRLPTADIARLVRSVSRPYPGARTAFEGRTLIVWRARTDACLPTVHGAPGQIVRLPGVDCPGVVCGDGVLLVEEVEGADGFNVSTLARCHQRRLGAAAHGDGTGVLS